MIVNHIFHKIHIPFYDIKSDIFIRCPAEMDTFIYADGIKEINAGKNVRVYPADIHGGILLSGFSQWGCSQPDAAVPAQSYYNTRKRKSRYFIKNLLHLLL